MSKTMIANRYLIDESIGSGAMADVYLSSDTQAGQVVAIKALKPEIVRQDPKLLERFRREGGALHDLNHPNIVNLLDIVEEDGRHYLVMEYVAGGDLSGLISQSPEGLHLDQVLSITLDLADALTRAHRLDIVHRDLKPANILIAEDGTPRLTDFGFSHMGQLDSLTGSGAVIGSRELPIRI
jgi:serine/threonine-protein kinase